MRTVENLPSCALSDDLVEDLEICYQVTQNRLLLRVNLAWLLEIQIKKISAVFTPELYQRSKGSHHVLRSLYRYKQYIPELDQFINRIFAFDNLGARLSAIQNFDYVGARYHNALEVFESDLPLVEDMFELYWVLSNVLRALNVY